MLKGKLFLAPIKDPKRILDIGTGTGIWAMEMGTTVPPGSQMVDFLVDDILTDMIHRNYRRRVPNNRCNTKLSSNQPSEVIC